MKNSRRQVLDMELPNGSTVLKLQFVALAAVISGIILLESSRASSLYLFEFLGALSASMLTVFGISRMREMT